MLKGKQIYITKSEIETLWHEIKELLDGEFDYCQPTHYGSTDIFIIRTEDAILRFKNLHSILDKLKERHAKD